MTWWALQASLLAGYLAVRLGRAGAREARWILGVSLALPMLASLRPDLVPMTDVAADLVPRSVSVQDVVVPLHATMPATFAVDLGLVLAAVGLARLAWAAFSVRRALARGVLLHRIGRVRVYAVPGQHFAAWWGGPVVAVDPGYDLLALRHELQHHRHGDAVRAWALLLLGVVAEPMATLWRNWLEGREEIAVDAAIVARGADPRTYARVLVAHAGPSFVPALARSLLYRRIQMLLTPRPRRSFAAALAVPFLAFSLGAAPRAVATGEPLNELVAVQLQRYTAGEGRAWAEGALARRDPSIRTRLEAAGLPGWLEAVAFVESGYRAEIKSRFPVDGPSVGFWQFIPSTARTYGLRVNDRVDERLDVDKSTDAAIALLTDLYAWNQEWPLALASYNQGQRVVRDAIAREGTRDAWELQRRGALNHYSAMVYAAAMLLE